MEKKTFFSLSTKLELNLNLRCMEQNQLSTCSRAPPTERQKNEFMLKDLDSMYLGSIIDFSSWPLTGHLISLLKFFCETD